ncbi:MAG: TetR/AcrR family transcriptional regulator [Alkalibacterium sp.]|nr:TetR/AcrR family transcriptional regulator [Alkalibacterium sp.]
MEQVKTDPRFTRTRQLIVDSFIKLSNKKEFTHVTVKDITEEAHINRATFYNHFLDKYDLLEKVVSEKLLLNLGCDQSRELLPLDLTIKKVFMALNQFGDHTASYCSSQEETETIDAMIHLHLNAIFSERLLNRQTTVDLNTITKLSGLLTHSVVGLSRDYAAFKQKESPEQFIESMIPYLLHGIDQPD